MRICYFGTYEQKYPLNSILIKGLRKNGVEVVECHEAVWEKYGNKTGSFLRPVSLLKLFIGILVAYFKLIYKFFWNCKNIDFYVVGYIGQVDMFLLKFLKFLKRDKKKIIFVPLFSIYDGAILDRELFKKSSLFAKMLFFIDKYSMKSADMVFLDTNEHIEYVSELFGIDIKKFRRSFVGADEDIFFPIEAEKDRQPSRQFTVLFFGKYIPLHGLEYIIEAAQLLRKEKDIKIKMVGSGQIYRQILELNERLKNENVEFISWIEHEKLVDEIKNADVVLGIFGGTEKSLRVIPNKVFQAVACRKPVITGDSLAIRELFTDGENIVLCNNRDPVSLRDSIIGLYEDKYFASVIAGQGYCLFKEQLNIEKIGAHFLNVVLTLERVGK
ncbi:MAG: glycosyltransferase [Candidatus Pacebacteria bacterium]|nr:glycosyltransferase [Candidatus Paceibacterota bacterium]